MSPFGENADGTNTGRSFRTNKVKGFSIEGYFADKMESPKEEVKEDMSAKSDQETLLKIIEILTSEKK